MKTFLLLILILGFAGCSSSRGFNRAQLREDMEVKAQVTDAEIAKVLNVKPQLPKPFKIGVYFKNPEYRMNQFQRNDEARWKWSDDDKNKILSLAEEITKSGEVSQMFAISDATVSSTDLKSLRLAAARHGADALLVVNGINDVDEYKNDWTWTYIAIAPVLFVPGTVTDSLFMIRAALWDVRNEFLYMTSEAESIKSETKPYAFSSPRDVTIAAKNEAMDKLRLEASKMIAQLTNKSKN